MSETPILRAEGLSAGYGPIAVVHDLHLHVDAGELVALLGANGVGKTTTLLALSGDLPCQNGSVAIKGRVTAAPLHQRARQGMAFVTEERSVFMSLSVLDNLLVGKCDIERAFMLFPELKGLQKRSAGLLSGGEQQMLTLARALSRELDLLLVDELSLGLSPIATERLYGALREAVDGGLAALVVEQHVNKVLGYSDRAYVLRRGRIAMEGPSQQIRARLTDVENVYLSSENDKQ